MSNFEQKNHIPVEGFGETLRQGRYYKKLSIEGVSKALNIQNKYLRALEEEDLDNLPDGLYSKNFLKQYSNFLELDTKKLVSEWDYKFAEYKIKNPFSKKKLKAYKLIVFPKIIRNILLISLVLICFLYLIFYFKHIISPPKLNIIQPNKNLLISNNSITVKGWTDPGAEVKINNENILNTNNGFFSQKVNLKKGINSLIISSQKQHSQIKTITREILVE